MREYSNQDLQADLILDPEGDLADWIELLKESPQVRLQVLGEARRAVELIVPDAWDW